MTASGRCSFASRHSADSSLSLGLAVASVVESGGEKPYRHGCRYDRGRCVAVKHLAMRGFFSADVGLPALVAANRPHALKWNQPPVGLQRRDALVVGVPLAVGVSIQGQIMHFSLSALPAHATSSLLRQFAGPSQYSAA
jgi:hypothetical protein